MIPNKLNNIEIKNKNNQNDLDKVIRISEQCHADYYHKKLIRIPILNNEDITLPGGIGG